MSKQAIKNILSWDTHNWGKALAYWYKSIENKNLNCLELGSNRGGLSLWLANLGHKVICSDLEDPISSAKELHDKFTHAQKNIKYEAINALEIPYENHFDIIIFKSILGGIAREGQNENKQAVIDQIHKALKPGGILLFAENLEASPMHIYFRKKFVNWGAEWNYLKLNEVETLFENFSNLEYETAGFLGTFGRTEKQRQLLGHIDSFLEKFISKKNRYIVFGVAKK